MRRFRLVVDSANIIQAVTPASLTIFSDLQIATLRERNKNETYRQVVVQSDTEPKQGTKVEDQ